MESQQQIGTTDISGRITLARVGPVNDEGLQGFQNGDEVTLALAEYADAVGQVALW